MTRGWQTCVVGGLMALVRFAVVIVTAVVVASCSGGSSETPTAPTSATNFNGSYVGLGVTTSEGGVPLSQPSSPSFRLTVMVANGVITGTQAGENRDPDDTGPATLPLSGTVGGSGAVTFAAPSGGGAGYSFSGSIATPSGSGASMTGTWSVPAVEGYSGGQSGTFTATRQ